MIINGKEYITGMGRNEGEDNLATHLYEGSYESPGAPMCRFGWNRSNGAAYSIFRNNISNKGICKTCQKRAEKDLPSVPAVEGSHKTKWI